jgi:hypothetical protein
MDRIDSAIAVLGSRTIDEELKQKALMSLLVDKGIITMEEFNERYALMIEKEFNGLRQNYLDDLQKASKV